MPVESKVAVGAWKIMWARCPIVTAGGPPPSRSTTVGASRRCWVPGTQYLTVAGCGGRTGWVGKVEMK